MGLQFVLYTIIVLNLLFFRKKLYFHRQLQMVKFNLKRKNVEEDITKTSDRTIDKYHILKRAMCVCKGTGMLGCA